MTKQLPRLRVLVAKFSMFAAGTCVATFATALASGEYLPAFIFAILAVVNIILGWVNES